MANNQASHSQSKTKAKRRSAYLTLDRELKRIATEAEAAARKAAQAHILHELRKLVGPYQLRLVYLTDRYIEVTGTNCDGSRA